MLSSPIPYFPPLHVLCFKPIKSIQCCRDVQGCRSMYENLSELKEATFLRKSDSSFPISCQLWIDPQLTLRICEFLSLEYRQLWSCAQSQSWVHESNGPVMSRSHGFTAVTLELLLLQSPLPSFAMIPEPWRGKGIWMSHLGLTICHLLFSTPGQLWVSILFIIYAFLFILKINLFLQYVLIVVPLPQFIPNFPHFPTHSNPHLFCFSH